MSGLVISGSVLWYITHVHLTIATHHRSHSLLLTPVHSVLPIELEYFAASAKMGSALVWDPTNALNALQDFLTLPSSYSMLLLVLV